MTSTVAMSERTDRGGPEGDVGEQPPLIAIPWRDVVRWALIGVLGVVAIVGVDVARHGGGNPVSLIQPGTEGPSIAVMRRDFPEVEPPTGLGLDGQQYYAVARAPMHVHQVSYHLDRPRYRLQRPVLPWLAWLLHPTGGGVGLIWALLGAGLLCVLAGSIAVGALSVTLGGKPWLAAVLPLLPGTYWSLRVTVADAPALALAMVALALSARRRRGAAVLVGVIAVLAKEPVILLFVGWALWRRDREGVALVAVPGLVAASWMLWLRSVLPELEGSVSEIGLLPFGGLVEAASERWIQGQEWVGMAASVGALVAGGVVLFRRRGHPLWWIVAVLMGFAAIMSGDVIGMNFGGTRSNQALALVAVLALATPAVARRSSQEVLRSRPSPEAVAPS